MHYENYIHLQSSLTALMHFMQEAREPEAVDVLLECKNSILKLDKEQGGER